MKKKRYTLWLKFSATNLTQSSVNPILSISYYQEPRPEIYIKTSLPSSTIRPLTLDSLNTASFSLPPGETAWIYLKTHYHQEIAESIQLGSYDQIMQHQQTSIWQGGIAAGLLAMVALANILLHLRRPTMLTGRPYPLLLSAAALLTLVFLGSWRGFYSQWLHLPVTLESWLHQIALPLTSLVFCQLAIKLFCYRRLTLRRYFKGLSIACLGTVLLPPFGNSELVHTLSLLLIFACSISFSLCFWLKKYRQQHIQPILFIPLITSQCLFVLNTTIPVGISSQAATWLLIHATSLTLGLLTLYPPIRAKAISLPKQEQPPLHKPEPGITNVLSSMGHELRTPLNGVLGMSELLLSTPITPKQQDYLETLYYAGHELGNLINLLADACKGSAESQLRDDKPSHVPEFINDIFANFQYRAEQHEIDLRCIIDDGIPEACYFNRYKLSLIIEAALFHAFSQSEQAVVSLRVALASANTPEHTHQLRFELTYNSHHTLPIAPEHLSRDGQFEDAKSESGMALSLFLAKDLIYSMGGTVGSNEADEGQRLWFTIPTSNSAKLPDHQISPLRGFTENSSEQQNVRVLIADDNTTCRKVLKQQCHLLGIQVEEAEDGLEALAKSRSEAYLERAYDVIILDHHMPGLKGLQVAERISADDRIKNQPAIIILTGVTNPPGKYQSSKLGISSVLTKPVTRFAVQRALTKALEKRQKTSAPTLESIAE